MLNTNTKAKLRDPAYFALHLQAMVALRDEGRFNWYDSHFLRRFEAAKRYLGIVCPDKLQMFEEGFAPLRPDPKFSIKVMDNVFDTATAAGIVEASRMAIADQNPLQQLENKAFGRDVIWDHPALSPLQDKMRPVLSGLIGCPLETSYSFLSRYGAAGVCNPHMDHPDSMFTFDYCIEQSEEWPIYFSKVMDWPTSQTASMLDLPNIKRDPSYEFRPYTLQPNQALLFNGSSQWHYRDPISTGGFCSLLFFHYFPAGCRNLVNPAKWATHFAIPELGPLCDLFERPDVDGIS